MTDKRRNPLTPARGRLRELVMILLAFGVITVMLLYLSRRPAWPPSRLADAVTWMLRMSLIAAVVWLVYWAADSSDDGDKGQQTLHQ